MSELVQIILATDPAVRNRSLDAFCQQASLATLQRECQALDQLRRYEATSAPVGEHLADQLLIPLAMAGAGAFRCHRPSLHTTTNADVIQRFLPVRFAFEDQPDGTTVVRVES